MTMNAANTAFVLSSSLRVRMIRRRAEAISAGLRLRYTVVRVNKDGSLPRRAEVSDHNSADTLDEARDLLARIEALNPGTSLAIVDRVEKTTV